MSERRVPFERYPGLSPLFLDFVRDASAPYPDRPTLESAVRRAREILGRRARIGADAFRWRDPASAQMARALEEGRAVAVLAGHQIGLFTGPLFTVSKAFDAVRLARAISDAGVPAVPVFYALTDDHDLEEIARTARPGPEGPEVLVLEGADRSNRRPVGPLPIPGKIEEIVAAFRRDAKGPDAEKILERFAARSAPGTSYRDAFIETLFDLVADPLLVLDPLSPPMERAAGELFAAAFEKRAEIERVLVETERALETEGRPVPVPGRGGVFPFFTIDSGERRRVDDPAKALQRISSGSAAASADVLTRPLLKSFAMPVAASVLGPAEIAYHAQALPLFAVAGIPGPVLFPRTFTVVTGPRERRAAEALGIPDEDLLSPDRRPARSDPPEAGTLERMARSLEEDLARLEPSLKELDPTLLGALETARRKAAHQLEQLGERVRKASEKKDEVAWNRRRRLETMLLPEGVPAERLYPPLVFLLAHGPAALDAIRAASGTSTDGAAVVELDGAAVAEEARHG
jgi:bacillithiol biosynthesis cysteine-adding enzyme BshC